jgi:hypothetical protein
MWNRTLLIESTYDTETSVKTQESLIILQTVAQNGRLTDELSSEFNDICCDWTRTCIKKGEGGSFNSSGRCQPYQQLLHLHPSAG